MTENAQSKTKLGGGYLGPHEKTSLKDFPVGLARLDFAAEYVRGKVVLDVACGSGYGSNFLLDKGAKMVVSGDVSVEAIEAARRLYDDSGLEYFVLDAMKLPFADNSLEAIVSIETIEHLERQDDFVAECERVLKDGGVFICSTPNRMMSIAEHRKINPYHIHELTATEFQELVSRYFPKMQLYGHPYWRKGERTLRILMFKTGMRVKAISPKLYKIGRFLISRIAHGRYVRLDEIGDMNKLLKDETIRPTPYIINSSPTPRDVVAVARKKGANDSG